MVEQSPQILASEEKATTTFVVERSLTSCVCARFPDRLSTLCLDTTVSLSDFVGPRVLACLGVSSHARVWQNYRGLLRTTVVTRGWNGHRASTES